MHTYSCTRSYQGHRVFKNKKVNSISPLFPPKVILSNILLYRCTHCSPSQSKTNTLITLTKSPIRAVETLHISVYLINTFISFQFSDCNSLPETDDHLKLNLLFAQTTLILSVNFILTYLIIFWWRKFYILQQ